MIRTSLLLVLLAPAARADDFFEKSVRPLLVEQCYKCHAGDKQKGGLRVDSREALLAGGDTGPALAPGKPDESLLVKAVRHQDLEMPPGNKLADDKVATLVKWVKDGAVWPAESAGAKTHSGGQQLRKPGQITDADRQWWAFQPVKAPPVPFVGEGWARDPIDRFVAAGHAAAGLTPAPEAGLSALARRVTFDLTGLPPTAADLDTVKADPSPEAYDKLVDRLLASPAYAERQARLWLDLVRYADSDGYRVDHPRPHAWKYRDYVVRSFAADKPYTQFVREQLAGDEVAPGDPDALLATGYLRQWAYEYNQRDVKGQWAAILNDLTDVTGDVFLGLGVGCARCHDHKFDPILQKDYYSLQSFFAGLSFREEAVFPAAGAQSEYAARLTAWEAETADIRAEMDAMLVAIRKKEMAGAANKFPDDIRAIFAKPEADRSTAEKQLYELSYRQVTYEFDRAPEKLKPADKPKFEELKKRLAAKLATKPADPTAMVARDHGPEAAPTSVPAGRNKGPVEPTFPVVFGRPAPAVESAQASTGRRKALADWLADPAHPLTARVMVNRVWQQHFGTGLVATASDYGTLGDKPSHPELLDHLAAGFVADGWSLKRLHLRIVLSATYRQAVAHPDGAKFAVTDPLNRKLWRGTVRRLDAEQVRDALLAVSGDLKPASGGPSTAPDALKRSVFSKVLRNTPDPLLAAFDAADGLTSCSRRNVTVTPTQSLLLLNGPFGLARATGFARRVMPADGKDAPAGVRAAFRLAYGRPPAEAELAEARSFLRQQVGVAAGKVVTPEARLTAWTDFCHALLNSNEFLYVD